ncbi:hypothetical protein [Glycomyces algeriensis]|uniref:Uncharacterized protein n=1 Tax=Glycomyces algeriensis TaxID=256037 RepID=A0A9W6LJ01_9ACTN|nr:hypothetical protein [Glycomyces algeriensis]MDA1365781.1 hypothetical protein [Glycomyces algeriensis]MDR7351470.1 uncharacterized protein YukE [Glycomyces algeriensis]GLI44191.1 hypothetical protein GALLR39Z86_40410 [Glycomyces algeriensis]
MSDGGFIEGSAPSGDAGSEFVTVFEADSGTDTAITYGEGTLDYDDTAFATYDGTAYTEMETATASAAIAFGDTAGLETGTERAGCTAGACPHPVAHPAETDWEQLASAVPVEGQLGRFKPFCEGMSYPTEDDFRAAVSAVRPIDPDSFSLQRLRTGWNEEVAAVIGDWPAQLKTKLTALSTGWAGTDFDAFADQTDQARTLLEGILDDIEAAAQELKHREEAVYTLQGGDSGEIPYPAPLVGADGEWTNLVAVHVRPAWWHGDCIQMTCEEAEKALELGGADPALAAEVRTFIEQKAGEAASTVVGTVVSEARVAAGEEAKASFGSRINAELAAYTERQAAIDESIGEKRAGQSEQLSALRTAGSDRSYPESADASYMDLEPPAMEQPAPPVPPQTTQDPTPVPPGGDGSVAATETGAETPANPWESTPAGEGGEVAGGLASGGGGGFGGMGGGFGSVPGGAGAPAGGSVGGGAFGSTMPGAFTAPGAPGAAPAGGAGGGAGGSRTAMVGGAPQQQQQAAEARKKQGKSEEDEEAEEEDLTFRETDFAWGYIRPGDDPYN